MTMTQTDTANTLSELAKELENEYVNYMQELISYNLGEQINLDNWKECNVIKGWINLYNIGLKSSTIEVLNGFFKTQEITYNNLKFEFAPLRIEKIKTLLEKITNIVNNNNKR